MCGRVCVFFSAFCVCFFMVADSLFRFFFPRNVSYTKALRTGRVWQGIGLGLGLGLGLAHI